MMRATEVHDPAKVARMQLAQLEPLTIPTKTAVSRSHLLFVGWPIP